MQQFFVNRSLIEFGAEVGVGTNLTPPVMYYENLQFLILLFLPLFQTAIYHNFFLF